MFREKLKHGLAGVLTQEPFLVGKGLGPVTHRILGTRRAKTARQNCILVAWGFETQMRLMWTKIDFVVAAT